MYEYILGVNQFGRPWFRRLPGLASKAPQGSAAICRAHLSVRRRPHQKGKGGSWFPRAAARPAGQTALNLVSLLISFQVCRCMALLCADPLPRNRLACSTVRLCWQNKGCVKRHEPIACGTSGISNRRTTCPARLRCSP